jgi:hypothetical protein
VLFPCGILSLWAQEKNPQDIQKSCRDFVQRLYDWYVPKALKASSSIFFANCSSSLTRAA